MTRAGTSDTLGRIMIDKTYPGGVTTTSPSDQPLRDTGFTSHRPDASFEQHDSLSFRELRRANVARLPLFRDRNGKLAHSQPDGSDWSEAEWLQAVMGELGELANLRKKVLRGDLTPLEALQSTADEIADVLI